MNKIYQMKADDEWYTLAVDIENFIKIVNIVKDKIIWCPFDDDNSNFVKVFKSHGFNVINSHINDGKDFYTYKPDKFDIIISNPPFKSKEMVFKRIIELDCPFALIFGIQAFSSGGVTRMLSKINAIELIFLTKRMRFTKDPLVTTNLTQPTFHSLWICRDITGNKLQFIDNKENHD